MKLEFDQTGRLTWTHCPEHGGNVPVDEHGVCVDCRRLDINRAALHRGELPCGRVQVVTGKVEQVGTIEDDNTISVELDNEAGTTLFIGCDGGPARQLARKFSARLYQRVSVPVFPIHMSEGRMTEAVVLGGPFALDGEE